MRYDPELVEPMRRELTDIGVRELLTADDVDRFTAAKEGTALLVINSVCGCAAGMARPGVRRALEHSNTPDRVATVFAGQDADAVARARSYFGEMPPSSPCLAMFKDGELVHFVPRHRIEGREAADVAADLIAAFDRFCGVPERT
ncbi:MAG: BrxA/BrxB family bacilliredoxin [Candidatus Eisenbacteria bacterium]